MRPVMIDLKSLIALCLLVRLPFLLLLPCCCLVVALLLFVCSGTAAAPFYTSTKTTSSSSSSSRRGSSSRRPVYVHEQCANFAPEVFVDEQERYCNVLSAIKRGRRTACGGGGRSAGSAGSGGGSESGGCGRAGATIGCVVGQCKKSFHLGCAFDSGWRFAAGDSTFICPTHRLDDAVR
jgi:hypothetical protein